MSFCILDLFCITPFYPKRAIRSVRAATLQSLPCGLYCNAFSQHSTLILSHKYAEPQTDLLPLIAAALRAEYGECPALCYGLGESDRLVERQLSFLQEIQERILERIAEGGSLHLRGASLGRMQQGLSAAGRTVSWSHPDTLLPDLPESDPGSDTSLSATGFPVDGTAQLDGLLLEGSINYLDQLSLLTRVRTVLKDEGFLFLFGENLDDDSQIARSPLANLSSLRQLSERLGYCLLEEQDYSANALDCVERLYGIASSRLSEIASALGITTEHVAALLGELQAIAAEFKSGRRCFRLFVLQKLGDPPGEYAHAEYGDIASFQPTEIASLFEASFGVKFDPELWHWKYTLGEGVCVVARAEPGAAIVSHYGGAPRQIEYFGDSTWAIQPCDVMVLPEVRRQYGRNSLFFKTAATFLEREIGNTVNHLLGFGFPNQKAMNIALRLGLYEKTDDFVEIQFPAAGGEESAHFVASADISGQDHRDEIDCLWEAMRLRYGEAIIGVRHSTYIDYRYFDHPFARRGHYRQYFLRDKSTGAARAFFVLKPHEQDQLLMDLVCATDAMPAMLAAINRFVGEQSDVGRLKFWLTREWQKRLQLPDVTVQELGIEIPCNSWNPGPSAGILYGAWWLTAGDMDFV